MRKGKIFDKIIKKLNENFEKLPDHRRGKNTQYEIRDAAVSAFGVFFTQSASFLAYQRLMEEKKGKNNLQNLFGVERTPSDNQVRNLLDGQDPEMLFDLFRYGLGVVQESGQLEDFKGESGQWLISADGTQTISSQKIECPSCSRRELANGETLYSHAAILPVIVKAGESSVLALEPEFISPQDGHEKQDCERAAIKRWLKRNDGRYDRYRYTFLGDDIYACHPICELFLDTGFNFILVCKTDSHVALYEQVDFLAKQDLIEQLRIRHWNGRYAEIHEYRFVNQVPLRRGDDALEVNWSEVTITREDTGRRLYYNTFITNHHLEETNIAAIVRDGRARWKSENETNNVLKTKGYHLEHNFGHGEQSLANFLLTLNLLAFLLHTLLDLLDEQYHLLRKHLVARKDFFNDLRVLPL